jgi:hypothetical protein
MRHENIYRLGEYLITEYENGLLRWETHFNFGVQRSGKCYIFGNILILGNWSNEESGYLQLEFSELLQKLPLWNSTHYYCFASELLDVSTGQSLMNDFLERYIALTRSTSSKPLMNMSPEMFRLGRYQITIDDNGKVSWQTYGGLNRVVGGQCVFESGIIFMDEQEYEGDQSKREFLKKLTQLPKWDNSVAWCRSLVLRPCHVEVQQTENSDSIAYRQDTMDEYSFIGKPSAPYLNQYKEPAKRLLRLSLKWLETAWHRIRRGKRRLKYLIPLFAVGLMFGLVLLWYSVEKKSHFSHGNKYHHKHNDD